MAIITEEQLRKICVEIREDRESIIRHNPIGSDEETLLWMLMSVLISFLNVGSSETPCFNGKPDEKTYMAAISFLLEKRRKDDFDPKRIIEEMLKK